MIVHSVLNALDKSSYIMQRVEIFYEGNNDTVGVLATSIASVSINTSSQLGIHILDAGISESNKRHLKELCDKYPNVSLIFNYVDLKIFEGLKGYKEENYLDCYCRLLIPYVDKNISKAIYLDSDTIALKDINLLWQTDLQGKPLAAPPDLGVAPWVLQHMMDLGMDSSQIYISAGVYIIDCELWRQQKITESLLSIAREKKDKLLIIIEDLFSLHFKQNFKVLDCSWGYIQCDVENAKYIPIDYITSEFLREKQNDISIIHFAGPNKVWLRTRSVVTKNRLLHFNDFWHYAKLTPFFEGLSKSFLFQEREEYSEEIVKLFGIVPLFKIRHKANRISIYLFTFLPILTIKFRK